MTAYYDYFANKLYKFRRGHKKINGPGVGLRTELGRCQGGHCPPKILPGPQKFFRLFLKVLHRPLTAPLVAKLDPPVAPPNENVWLRLCPGRISLGGPVNMTSDVMFSDKFLMSDVLWTNLMLTGFLFFPHFLSFQDENKIDS